MRFFLTVPGEKLAIEGDYPQCHSCKGKLNSFEAVPQADEVVCKRVVWP